MTTKDGRLTLGCIFLLMGLVLIVFGSMYIASYGVLHGRLPWQDDPIVQVMATPIPTPIPEPTAEPNRFSGKMGLDGVSVSIPSDTFNPNISISWMFGLSISVILLIGGSILLLAGMLIRKGEIKWAGILMIVGMIILNLQTIPGLLAFSNLLIALVAIIGLICFTLIALGIGALFSPKNNEVVISEGGFTAKSTDDPRYRG